MNQSVGSRKQYKKDSLKHGLSFSERENLPKSHLVLPAVLVNADLPRGTALSFSCCVRIFVIAAQESFLYLPDVLILLLQKSVSFQVDFFSF